MVLPVIPLIIAAVSVVDIGLMVGTGKDIIEHTTGVDIWAPVMDWIFGPDAVAEDPAVADPLIFLCLALIGIGIIGYWIATPKRKKVR